MALLAKRVLVTGSTSGIGLGIARVMANHGAELVLTGFGKDSEIETIVSDIRSTHSVECRHVPNIDLSTEKGCIDLMNSAGPVDVLVNNAGMQHVAPIEDFSAAKWDKVIALNLTACFHTTRLALPHMRENGYGRIINIASAHGLVASANKAAYVAAKHGVVGLTKVTALETADCANVTANSIIPGWVLTPLVAAQIEARAASNGTSFDFEKDLLLREKQPWYVNSLLLPPSPFFVLLRSSCRVVSWMLHANSASLKSPPPFIF
jgi:3-hydroxybutyrate dehydrogenase